MIFAFIYVRGKIMFCNCGYFNNPFLMRSSFGLQFMAPNMFFNNMFFMFSFMSAFRQPLFVPFQIFPNMALLQYQNGQSIFNVPKISQPVVNNPYPVITTPKSEKTEEPEKTEKVKEPEDKTVVKKPKKEKTVNKPDKKPTVTKKELGPEFLSRTKQIAQKLNCDYRDLLAVMNSESGMNSKAVNRTTGATGLIQFMPSTAEGLGTSVEALKNMSPIEQLEFVEKYLSRMKKAAGFAPNDKLSGADLYALIFLPGRAKYEVLTNQNEKYYRPNRGLDLNKDGKITKTELGNHLTKKRVNESIFA